MNRKKRGIFLICFLALDFFLIALFLFIQSSMQEDLLKREVQGLTALDITKDRYNTKIQTRGKYAIVEKTIKSYLDEYALHLQEVLRLMQDSNFTTLLSANNYAKDGGDFQNSFSYLETTKQEFNEDISQLMEGCSEEKVMQKISDVIDEPYYISLYKDLMLSQDRTQDFLEMQKFLSDIKTKMNTIFEVSEEVFSFLKTNQGQWKIENGQIQFQNVMLVNQYNSYIEKIPA